MALARAPHRAAMRSLLAAVLLASVLLAAGAALSLFGEAPAAPAQGAAPGMAMGGPAAMGMGGAHDWHGGTGTIPSELDALTKLERRSSIAIRNDSQFNPANGVRSGTGTFDNPFVISGWDVDTVLIADTSKAFEFKENRVTSILVLDWTGQGGYVHHNDIANLRTNRNVPRSGDATAAVIENNRIAEVQELRHFDGELRDNVIGTPLPLGATQPEVILNIAGVNGAGIHDNTIYGGVDMKLHGHHHSDAPNGTSHNHGTPDNATMAAQHMDHQMRYDSFDFYQNHVIDDRFGLRYNDLNHAADDRTAASEQEPDLDLPHVHHTFITIRDNVIEGAALSLVVVNAPDPLHLAGESALVDVRNNTIVKPMTGDGILLQDVRNATVHIHGNHVDPSVSGASGASAIFLARFHNTTIMIDGNDLGADGYGIRASQFDASTTWIVGPNDDAATHPVYWDSTVANPPQQQAPPPASDSMGGGSPEPAATDALLAPLRAMG
jgi:hypothetical protein